MVKYLIVGPSWIGDMIIANGLFRLLKQNNPECIIDVLAPNWSHAVITRMHEVRRAISMPLQHGALNLFTRYSIAKSLRQEQYDEAIILPNSWKSGLIPYFARISKRTGWRGEWRYFLLNDMRILKKKQYPLMIDRYLALGQPKAVIELTKINYRPSLTVDRTARQQLMEKYRISEKKPFVILCPGAQYGSSKRWPDSYFSEVASYCLTQGWQIGLLGGKAEKEIAAKINHEVHHQATDLTMTQLTEAIDLLSAATVVVSNDSGLMHMAAAVNRPVIAIYGSSSADFTPPLGEKTVILSKTLPCKPCFKRECPLGHLDCLIKITPEEVIHSINYFCGV